MIALLDTSEDLAVCSAELGLPVGQLLTPLTRFKRRSDLFAIDNGAFSKFNEKGFLSLLEREEDAIDLCKFVAVPDVVGSARRTLECFDRWYERINHWPLALVAQDGQEDLAIPWDDIAAIFIGGSTRWKMSNEALQVVKAAKILGKWVHIGRVNEEDRFSHFEGFADSFDGSGVAQYSKQRLAINRKMQSSKLEFV